MAMPERIRAADVARLTSLSVRGVQGLAARGKIPGAGKCGRLWTFDRLKVERWIREMEAEAWPSEPQKDATGADLFYGGSSPSPATSTAARYEQLIRQKPGDGIKPGASR